MAEPKKKESKEEEARLTDKYGKLKLLKTSEYMKTLTKGES
jgi:hypothetical protein|tara:strand:- start:21040 stop:21162 length:123 start_codon:yes stop_codon:yes gene_type:complete